MKANVLGPFTYFLSACVLLGVALPQTPSSQDQQKSGPERSLIQIENWSSPQHGWLYVLDPEPGDGTLGGRIWLVDAGNGKVMGSIRTGESPDFALSPDGSRLYVASLVDDSSSEMSVIDTSRGIVLKGGKVGGRATAKGLPPFSTMAVSGDGGALRMLIATAKSEDADSFLLADFDTQQGEFLPGIVHLGNCGPGRFISYPAVDHFDVWCPRTNRVRMIRVDAESKEMQNVDVKLPWERREGVGEAIELPGSPKVEIVRGDGGVFEMDTATQEVTETKAHPDLPNRVPPAAWPMSPDGSRLYLGYSNNYYRPFDNRFYLDYGRPPNIRLDREIAGEFRVFDTSSWKKIGRIKTKMPFWSAAITNDGATLYAMAPQSQSILVIDTAKMRQVREFKVGGAPALAIVAP